MGANADRTRAWITAFNERDFEVLAGAGQDIEWVVAEEHPAATTHRSPEAVRFYLEDWLATMPDLRIEIDELLESENVVLMVGRATGAGAGSGAGTGVALCSLGTFEGHLPVRVEEFLDPEAARAEFQRRTGAPE